MRRARLVHDRKRAVAGVSRGGFTLFEVLISVAIFVLLAGGIFSSINIAITASAEVSESQLATSRMEAFQRFCRTVFLNLPEEADVELRIRQEAGAGDVVELLIAPAPELADFGSAGVPSDGLALSARPDGNGMFTMCVANYDAALEPARRDAFLMDGAAWLPILPEVRTLRWRFSGEDPEVLTETWIAGQGRPSMVDLELTRREGSVLPLQFFVPPLLDAEGGDGGDGNPPPAGDQDGDAPPGGGL